MTGRRDKLTAPVEVAPPLSVVVLTTRGTSVVTAGLCLLELTEERRRHLVDVPEDGCLRANDAGADPAGRLWIGTMSLPGRPAPGRRRAGAGALFRVATGATGLPATRTELG
jgi:sugar lactone lactonase YvrE